MRIAIDARELVGHRTGVGRYLWHLLVAWNEIPAASGHELLLCLPPPTGQRIHALPNLHVRYVSLPWFRGTLWEQLSLPLVRDADVLFAPAYSGPALSRVPMVVTVHDVSFAAHPEWFGWREGFRRRVLTRAAAHRAARVLTVSDFSKREIVKHLRIDPAKVEVIYSGVHQVIPTDPPATMAVETNQPLILYVGSVFNRRHLPELIEGFNLLARQHPGVRLAIVGENRTQPPIDLHAVARASDAAGRIRICDYVSDAELASLYREAAAFAFLSEYEGFGFTPLEALAVGVPPVVLDTEVAREIYGPSAAYVREPRPDAIAAALRVVLFDAPERERILDAAPGVLARYSWRECAQRTLQVLLACAS